MTKAAHIAVGVLLSGAAVGQVPSNLPAGSPLDTIGPASPQALGPTDQLTQTQRAAAARAAADVARRQTDIKPEAALSDQRANTELPQGPGPNYDVNVPDEPARSGNGTSPYGSGIRLPWSSGIRTPW